MADVLELDNAEEFEVDDEGDRKCTPLCIIIVELNWAYCVINWVKPYYFLSRYEYYVPAVSTVFNIHISLGHVSILLID